VLKVMWVITLAKRCRIHRAESPPGSFLVYDGKISLCAHSYTGACACRYVHMRPHSPSMWPPGNILHGVGGMAEAEARAKTQVDTEERRANLQSSHSIPGMHIILAYIVLRPMGHRI